MMWDWRLEDGEDEVLTGGGWRAEMFRSFGLELFLLLSGTFFC